MYLPVTQEFLPVRMSAFVFEKTRKTCAVILKAVFKINVNIQKGWSCGSRGRMPA
jgi:hypothetical protein